MPPATVVINVVSLPEQIVLGEAASVADVGDAFTATVIGAGNIAGEQPLASIIDVIV